MLRVREPFLGLQHEKVYQSNYGWGEFRVIKTLFCKASRKITLIFELFSVT